MENVSLNEKMLKYLLDLVKQDIDMMDITLDTTRNRIIRGDWDLAHVVEGVIAETLSIPETTMR